MTSSIFSHRIAWVQLPPNLRRGRHRLRVAHGPARSLLLYGQHTVQAIAAHRLPRAAQSVAMYTVLPVALYAVLVLAMVGAR